MEPPVAFGGQYRSAMPVRLRRASSASRAKNQERGRGASERRTWAQRAGTALPLFPRTGPRSWTKDGFSSFDALLGGRLTANGGRLLNKWSLSLFLLNIGLVSRFEGRVHDLGRRTGFRCSSRRTVDGERLFFRSSSFWRSLH